MTKYLQEKTLYPPLIPKRPPTNLGIVVVIPAYNEPYLLLSLMALKKCKKPRAAVEVIILINEPLGCSSEISAQNQATYERCSEWAKNESRAEFKFYPIYLKDLPKKYAGVGLARKIGMDEACYRFEKAGQKTGIIACFDADSRCDPNYFVAIESAFETAPKWQAASIHFEHPLTGPDFSTAVYDAIADYELHLRYYINAQRWAGFPFAYQTIGSSMAVRANAYQAQGGMNKRKAGEDFYFLQKFIELGSFGEIKTTKVIPSPRPSDRVPFGTGKAVSKILNNSGELTTYAPQSFVDIKAFFENITNFYNSDLNLKHLPESVVSFLEQQNWSKERERIQSNTASVEAFQKQTFRWFNAFRLMKFLHFSRDHFYPDIPVTAAAKWLLAQFASSSESMHSKDLLYAFRRWDLID